MVISTIPDRQSATKSSASPSQLFTDLDRHRRKSPWRWCGCVFLLGIVGLVGTALWLIAATGVINIPGISTSVFPSQPGPGRVVMPTPFSVVERMKEGANLESETVTFTLTEGEISSLISSEHFPMFRQAQVTVDPDGLRFFATYVEQPLGSPISLGFRLVPASTPLDHCTIDQLRIGHLPVPAPIYRSYVDQNCESIENLVTQSIREQRIRVELTAGALTVHEQLSAEPAIEAR